MLDRYVATVKAYGDVRAGLVDPYASRVGSAVSDAWEERILPKKERTFGEGVKRWWRALGEKPLRTLRDMVAACATTPIVHASQPTGWRAGSRAGTLADIADGWEFGAKRGLVMVGIRADGEVLPLRMLRSTGNPVVRRRPHRRRGRRGEEGRQALGTNDVPHRRDLDAVRGDRRHHGAAPPPRLWPAASLRTSRTPRSCTRSRSWSMPVPTCGPCLHQRRALRPDRYPRSPRVVDPGGDRHRPGRPFLGLLRPEDSDRGRRRGTAPW